ncbi:Tat pathway signal protein [Ochrobactrum sp. POC9]|uniref:Acg family FMN-binding oxidoreductase n=1 Tax=Ochrobactrum sp. POC9 TaxID=2203419 RepID=UPI000D70770E|nr:nitroreductase family protein [Ochrobactrum sp. POC9]PWU71079.1 Tat pathway signal protein [Ochrobactrum sp. POC9]
MNRRAMLIGSGSAALLTLGGTGFVALSGSMTGYNDAMARARRPLAEEPGLRELVRYSTLAANSHNTQPWLFRLGANSVEVLPDFSRRTPVVDPDDHHLFVSLGCAAQNLAIAAQAAGRPGEITINSDGMGLNYDFVAGPERPTSLLAAITLRQSTRAPYDGRSVSTADLAVLTRSADIEGVDLVLLTDRARIDTVRELVVAGNTAQMSDPAFMRELKDWLRFTPRAALAAGDGLFSATSGNPVLPDWLGELFFDWFFSAKAENDKYARQIDSSAGIAIFVGEHADWEHWIRVGRACQNFALTATSLGLRHAFLNQPLEVAELRPELARLAGVPDKRPDIVMRFGYGPTLPFSSRRPIEAVIV